ncbi:MAG TPA: prenyltransferase/squalene oxidase repeat-containing protein [Sedimentisphaerales bacterium]|nr:prenyltransferase/squalene oxidase repeat-containing protein [Sedimentisphaerales bacterium]
MEVRVLLQQIDGCLERVRILLESSLVSIDGKRGWRQYLDESGSPGTYGTACGLITYANIPTARRNLITDVVSTIVSRQQEDGSWASSTIAENVGLTTATTYSLLALMESGVPVDPDIFARAIVWLEGVVMQNGATSDYLGHTEYNTTCAAMLLRVLGNMQEQELTKRIIDGLVSCREKDAGWGYYPNSKSTIDHTALAIVGLSCTRYPMDSPEIGGAIAYLMAEYIPGSKENNQRQDLKYVEKGDLRRLLPYHFFTDGLVGLAYLGVIKHYDVIERIIDVTEHLIGTQAENGHWVHVGVPEKQPSWALAEAVLFLGRMRLLLVEDGRLLSLEQWQKHVDEQIDELSQVLDRVECRTRGIPGAIRILRLWPLQAIFGGLLFYIAIKIHIPASPWSDIVAVVVGISATIIAGYFIYRKGKNE